MENSSIDGSIEPVGGESKIPLILAIAAFVLGGLSFVFAWSTKNNLSRHKDAIEKRVAEAVDTAKKAAADANSVGGNGEFASLKTDFEELEAKHKADFQVIANRQVQLQNNAKTTDARLARLEGGKGSAGTSSASAGTPQGGQSAAAGPASAQPSGGKYTVQAGDNPSKIAKKLGIPLNDLMAANPGLDPKRLRVGQEINVPEKK